MKVGSQIIVNQNQITQKQTAYNNDSTISNYVLSIHEIVTKKLVFLLFDSGGPVGISRHGITYDVGLVYKLYRRTVLGICHGYIAGPGDVEPFVQLHLSGWTAEIELSPPIELRSLLDPFNSEWGIRSTR